MNATVGADEADVAVRAAAADVGGRPLRLIERRDIGPDTSNQWILHYQ